MISVQSDKAPFIAASRAKWLYKAASWYGALFLCTLGLSWYSGVFRSEFGRYQDEGMHYLTGLMIQDFIASGHWSHPMQFAQQYYLHLPKIALGQWPPGFSLMQTAWGLVFGVSRVSMMFGMIVLTAWLAYLVYRVAAASFGPWFGFAGALMLIAAPLTQEQTAMVMAEVPLAATSLLAILALARFLESESRGDAIAFALWTFAAIMIKGNGWAVVLAAPVIVLVTGRLRLLRSAWLWISAALIGILCVPYTLITMKLVSQGWDTRSFPGFAYEWESLGIHLGFVANTIGIPLALVALLGAAVALYRRETLWTSLTIYGLVIIVFHVAVPSSIEPRKIYQILPVMCLLALAAVDALIGKIAGSPFVRPAAAAIVLAVFGFTGFTLLPRYEPGFREAVEAVIARADSKGAAVLVSSNPQWADSEAAIIAEWAERTRNDGTYLIRGTKLLSHPVPGPPGGLEFALNATDAPEVLQVLSSIPVSYVILHTAPSRISYPHHDLLRSALQSDPANWERIYRSERVTDSPERPHTIEIYHYRKSVAGVPIRYSVDLSRKVGVELNTSP